MTTVSNRKATFQCPVEKLWGIVTDNRNYAWRSDVERIEILNDDTFVEYSKDGFKTTFKISAKEYCKRYEFDMENKNMKGHWIGLFEEVEGGTEIDFTEEVCAANPVMGLLLKPFLKKQQQLYVTDLGKKVSGQE